MILLGTADIFILSLPGVVCEEVLVGDGINVNMLRGFDGRSNEVGFMLFGVGREGAEEFLGLVEKFFDREGFPDPVNHGIKFLQPRES